MGRGRMVRHITYGAAKPGATAPVSLHLGKEGRGGMPRAHPARQGFAPTGIPPIAMAHSTDAHTPRSVSYGNRGLLDNWCDDSYANCAL
jgi:hypothetical protein